MGKSKYNINKDFSSFTTICAIANPVSNTDRKKIKSRKVKIKSFDGKCIKNTIIEPKQEKENSPCLVYFHGGAFRYPSVPYQLRMAHRYANSAQCKVVFVNYRLAPKHPFPAPVEDGYSTLKWVYENSSELGIDVNRIAVGGDSAGGALAAAIAQMSRDRNGPHVCFQLLIYPVIDCDMQTESMKTFYDTPIWDSIKSKDMWKKYLKNGDQGLLAYASPIKAESLAGLPSAYVEIAEFDCLRDEGVNYALRLQEAGVPVELVQTKGTIHAYDMVFKSIAKENFEKRITALNKAFRS